MEEITAAYVRRLLPRRDPMGHKGTFGKVYCLCGAVFSRRRIKQCRLLDTASRGHFRDAIGPKAL